LCYCPFFFSSRRRHTRFSRDWSSDVCSSDLTATYLIACTANFAGKPSGKQLACYAGVAPFEHSSGISVRGRTRVHRMANKDLKKLLHLCALSVIRYNQEFKTYYNRKKEEGKHSMSILN